MRKENESNQRSRPQSEHQQFCGNKIATNSNKTRNINVNYEMRKRERKGHRLARGSSDCRNPIVRVNQIHPNLNRKWFLKGYRKNECHIDIKKWRKHRKRGQVEYEVQEYSGGVPGAKGRCCAMEIILQ